MTVIDFYNELTTLMSEYKAGDYTLGGAKTELEKLRQKGKKEGIQHIRVSDKIFEQIDQEQYDDSYESSMIC